MSDPALVTTAATSSATGSPVESATPARVAFVVKGYPRLSETFIAQEIEALEARGLNILIVSLRQPTDKAIHPIHERIRAQCLYLPEYLYRAPGRVLDGWRRVRGRPGYAAARRTWLADLGRDPSPNRIRRFGQALVLAAELPPDIRHLHAHFLHTPASVARYAAAIRGIEWTVSAHAKDIWTTSEPEKRDKLASASWAVTCTAAGQAHLAGLAPSPDTVALCYHGLALDHFPEPEARPMVADGTDPAHPVILLSVGRLVEKKGYDVLLTALSRLPPGLFWRLVHVGGGPLGAALKRQAQRLDLEGRIEWRGAGPQPDVLAAYREADLFVLAAKTAKNGDRDGLPNVLMEAQSQGLACVATNLSGIPELISNEETGLLVPPGDTDALAAAITRLMRDPEQRGRFGAAGLARVRRDFNLVSGIDFLARRFGLPTTVRPRSEPAPLDSSASPMVFHSAALASSEQPIVVVSAPIAPLASALTVAAAPLTASVEPALVAAPPISAEPAPAAVPAAPPTPVEAPEPEGAPSSAMEERLEPAIDNNPAPAEIIALADATAAKPQRMGAALGMRSRHGRRA